MVRRERITITTVDASLAHKRLASTVSKRLDGGENGSVRKSYDYRRNVWGKCEHLCVIWPQRIQHGKPAVVCHTCSKGREIGDEVWVEFNNGGYDEEGRPIKKTVPKKRTPAKPKPRKLSIWEQLMED